MNLYTDQIKSPIGQITLIANDKAVIFLDFTDNQNRIKKLLEKRFGAYNLSPKKLEWSDAISHYFAGDFAALENIPTETGGTDFQQRVWQGLRQIPVGQTKSYLEMAKLLGQPTATRAVGMTNGLNPVALILPCHRVIGANGKLTGYAGGLERKRWLLAHESKNSGLAL